MNFAALAPDWLVWTLVALLIAASIEDAVRLRISNLTCLGVFLTALAAIFVVGPQWGLWQNFAVFAGLLLSGTLLFAAGKMGGGDVKLLAAVGLWFDLDSALLMLLWVLIAGGVLAILILMLRLFDWSDKALARVELLRPKGGIPYGLAIAAGALLSLSLARGWG